MLARKKICTQAAKYKDVKNGIGALLKDHLQFGRIIAEKYAARESG